MKKRRIYFWIPSILLAAMTAMSTYVYFSDVNNMMANYQALGYPDYLVYFNGIAKILGIGAILTPAASKTLKEWAYAGLCYVYILGGLAHVMINDGQQIGAIIALVLLSLSYWQWKKG